MRRHLPPLNALRAFEAAGRLGRLGLAALELSVTHGAVSRQVRQLETWLGVRLFEGSRHAPVLSDAGARLLPALSGALDQMDAAVRDITATGEQVLNISCPGTFTMKWLIPRLHHFHARHPDIEVRLSARGTSADPLPDNMDMAVRVGGGQWPLDVTVIPLFREYFGPVQLPSIHVDACTSVRVPLLHTTSRRSAWQDWQRLSGRTLSGNGESEYEHFYFMLEAAMAGLGVAIAPWPLVADAVTSGRLTAPFGFIPSGLDYVVLKQTRHHREADIFCAWLQGAARDYAAAPD